MQCSLCTGLRTSAKACGASVQVAAPRATEPLRAGAKTVQFRTARRRRTGTAAPFAPPRAELSTVDS